MYNMPSKHGTTIRLPTMATYHMIDTYALDKSTKPMFFVSFFGLRPASVSSLSTGVMGKRTHMIRQLETEDGVLHSGNYNRTSIALLYLFHTKHTRSGLLSHKQTEIRSYPPQMRVTGLTNAVRQHYYLHVKLK